MKTVQSKLNEEDMALLNDEVERQGITTSQHIRNLIRRDNRWQETEKLLLKQQAILLEILKTSIKGGLSTTVFVEEKESKEQAIAFNTRLNSEAKSALLKALTRIEGGNNGQQ